MKTVGSGLFLVGAALLFGCDARQDRAEVVPNHASNDRIPIIVTLKQSIDLAPFQQIVDKHARRAQIVQALQARTQAPMRQYLLDRGATDVRWLWLINGFAAKAPAALLQSLPTLPFVQSVTADATLHVPVTIPGAIVPEWNLAAIQAPAVWQLGVDGTGVVVANMDTGVDFQHSDLQAKWRGGIDSWWDPYRNTTTPYDAIGHGTQTMGLMVGGSGGGTAIGVAPGAKWIAAKIYDDNGNTTVSVIHEAFQWLLGPSGIAGAPDAPDVVNASWGLATANVCDTTFQSDFEALRAAGVVVVFAAGNSGPSSSTSLSPANNQDGFSIGAVDATNFVASFSSRGASACTGGIYPDLVAPGVNVKSSDISLAGIPQYTYLTGTSAAAPHVAGVAALLLSAQAHTPVAVIEETLRKTAHILGSAGPDDVYGYGLVDAYAAYQSLSAPCGQ